MNKFLLLLLLFHSMIAPPLGGATTNTAPPTPTKSPLSHHNLIKHQPCSVELITAHTLLPYRHYITILSLSSQKTHRWNDGRCCVRRRRRRSAAHNKVHLIRPEQANAVNILLEFLKLKYSNRRNCKARYMALGFFLHELRPKKPYALYEIYREFHCHLLF